MHTGAVGNVSHYDSDGHGFDSKPSHRNIALFSSQVTSLSKTFTRTQSLKGLSTTPGFRKAYHAIILAIHKTQTAATKSCASCHVSCKHFWDRHSLSWFLAEGQQGRCDLDQEQCLRHEFHPEHNTKQTPGGEFHEIQLSFACALLQVCHHGFVVPITTRSPPICGVGKTQRH